MPPPNPPHEPSNPGLPLDRGPSQTQTNDIGSGGGGLVLPKKLGLKELAGVVGFLVVLGMGYALLRHQVETNTLALEDCRATNRIIAGTLCYWCSEQMQDPTKCRDICGI